MSTEDRNQAVLAVLRATDQALGPTEIAKRVNAQWCVHPIHGPQSAPVTPVLRRIGALRVGQGRYLCPPEARHA